MQTVPFFCGKDCGGNACPLLAEVDDGRVNRVINNPAGGKYLKGCIRGFNAPLTQYAPDRLLSPLIRSGPRGCGQFRQATWDEALTLTAQRLGEIQAKYGPTSVVDMSSAGSTGALHNTMALLRRFLDFCGGYTCLSSNYSNSALRFMIPYLLGKDWTQSGFDPATAQYANLVILWGANILETRMGTELPQQLMEAKKRGVEIISIEPRRSLTARQLATKWIPCRPGTDTALMLAVLYILISENLLDRRFIQDHSTGFNQLERYILGQQDGIAHTPEWASAICGTPLEDINFLAHTYASAKPAMLIPGYSIQRVQAGEEVFRLTVTLQIATGNLGIRGGSSGASNSALPSPLVGSIQCRPPKNQPSLPILRWPDAILQGRAGGYPTDIHAAYIAGSNLINQGSDIKKSQAAFEKLDFVVSHDLFLTPSVMYSDVVFPAVSPLEKEDIGIPWLGNYLLYKPQILTPVGQARNDYEILWDLADRMGFGAQFSENHSAQEWIQIFIEQSEIPDPAAFRNSGIYLAPDQERIGLANFSADPQRFPLSTPSGKVEIACQKYAAETGGSIIPIWRNPSTDENYPLSLITPKIAHRIHSQGSNLSLLQQKYPHVLTIHPFDAAARSIHDQDQVRVFNSLGELWIQAKISDEVMPGVTSLPEGVWVNRNAQGIDISGSTNMLTDTSGTTPSTSCIMHGVAVQVAAIEKA